MPALATSVVNTATSAFTSGYTAGNYIADELFPVVEHDKPSGTYISTNKADIITEYEDLGSLEAETGFIDYATSKTDFTLVPRYLGALVPYALIDAASDPQKPRERYAALVMNALALKHERRVAAIALTTGSYASANTFAAAAPWSNATTGTPVDDFHKALALLAPADPNKTKVVVGMALEAFQALSRHPQLLGLRSGGGTVDGVLGVDEVAKKLGVDEIHVSNAQYLTSARGATVTASRIWDTTKCVIVRRPKAIPSFEDAASMFGCSFRWSSPSQTPFQAVEWDVPGKGPGMGSLAQKVTHWTLAGVIVQNDMGCLLTTVTS